MRIPDVALNDGKRIPWLGLGVYGLSAGGQCEAACKEAISVGYRMFDSATFYGNEQDVGRSVRASGVPREDIFVTTKLWKTDQGYASAMRALDQSLSRLGLDYVDLYLIHWPEPVKRLDAWSALVELRKKGKCRSIGVSNYTVEHLKELMATTSALPAVNQVEFSPFLFQKELLEFCKAHGIQVEGYGSLTRGVQLAHPAVAKAAQKHGRTAAQVMLRWALQHDVIIIPKTQRPERMRENAAVFDFELDAEDMAALNALDSRLRTSADPTGV